MSASSARRTRRANAGRASGHRSAGGPSQPVAAAGELPNAPAPQACAALEWRAFLAKMTPLSPPPVRWYGTAPSWQVALEAAARREYGAALRVSEYPGRLEYRIKLDVRGPNDLVEVTVVFYAEPPYDTYRLDPWDYPRVWAERDQLSKHRMPDGALCLYFPDDPVELRWTADKGLLDLLDIVTDHLGYEAHWRATGGPAAGVWLGAEAEHGFEQKAA